MPRPPGPPARAPTRGDAPRRRGGRRVGGVLLGLTTVLAVAGAVTLALTEDARWLRLGIVAALWAALAGAFAAARYRRDAGGPAHAGQWREGEAVPGREHEPQASADARRRLAAEVRAEVRGELDGLRAELQALRQTLEGLLGGELMVERVALRAESTRLRPLAEQPRPPARELPHGSGPQRPSPVTQAAAQQRGQQPRPAQRPGLETGRSQPPAARARPAAEPTPPGTSWPGAAPAPAQRTHSPATAGPSWPRRVEPADTNAPGRRRRVEDEPTTGLPNPAEPPHPSGRPYPSGRRYVESGGAPTAGRAMRGQPPGREGGEPAPNRHRRAEG